jgi:hypothetical protein
MAQLQHNGIALKAAKMLQVKIVKITARQIPWVMMAEVKLKAQGPMHPNLPHGR